jgi:hypothetical protein
VTLIHDAFDTAVQAQPAVAVTATVPTPPADAIDAASTPSEKVHDGVGGGAGGEGGGGGGAGGGAGGVGGGAGGVGVGEGGFGGGASAAAWLTTTVCPAMVAAPVRSAPSLAATRSTTEPLPLRAAVPSMAIHEAWLAAVQPHPVSVSTVTATDPPAAGGEAAAGETRYRHGAASWTMETCVSLTSMTPRRSTASPFGDTRKATDPLPCPPRSDVNAIQVTLLETDHVQSLVVVTSRVAVVPSDGTAAVADGDTDTSQRAVVGAVTLSSADEHAANPRASETARSCRANAPLRIAN